MKKIILTICVAALSLVIYADSAKYDFTKEKYQEMSDYCGFMTLPGNLKNGIFACRMVNITDKNKILDMKSVIYPLINFTAEVKVSSDPDTITSTCDANQLGYYWENDESIEIQKVGNNDTKGYSNRAYMQTLTDPWWWGGNVIELPPGTYIGHMIPASRVVIIPPLMERLKKDARHWMLYFKTYAFPPGVSPDSFGMQMFPVSDIFDLILSNKIESNSEFLKESLKVDIEKELKKNNSTEYVVHLEMLPEDNKMFLDIIAIVPIRIYIKGQPNVIKLADRTKRIAFKSLDTTEWKWHVKADGKVIAEVLGGTMKFPNLNKRKSAPWMLRHMMIGRVFTFTKMDVFRKLKAYLTKNRDKRCSLSVTLPPVFLLHFIMYPRCKN